MEEGSPIWYEVGKIGSSGLRVGKFWVMMPYEAFGNRAEQIYFALLKCRRDGLRLVLIKRKIALFWKFKFRHANFSLLDVKHELIVESIFLEMVSWLVSILQAFVRIVTIPTYKVLSMMLPSDRESFLFLLGLSDFSFGYNELWDDIQFPFSRASMRIDWNREFANRLNISFLPRDVLDRRFPELKGRRFVCIHVREASFHNEKKYSCRNANIEHCRDAIKYLVDNGYIVVRLGDPSMSRLEMDGLIDYPHSDRKSDENDILLIEHCDYYIGMQSGPIDVAGLFEKRILAINVYSLTNSFWYRDGSRFISQKISKDGGVISLKKQIDLNLFDADGSGEMHGDVEYIENSDEEIQSAVVEFVSSTKLSESQIKFNEYLVEKIFMYLDSVMVWRTERNDALEKARWSSRIGVMGGSICAGYLASNFD